MEGATRANAGGIQSLSSLWVNGALTLRLPSSTRSGVRCGIDFNSRSCSASESRRQPPRGCGILKSGNGSGRGQRAQGRDSGQTEARQPILVYAMKCREDSDDADVIAGTFFIHFALYFDLIDIRSTHSYIASTISVKLDIAAECTAREVSVISSLGQSIRVDKGVVFPTNVMELPFSELDLIFGMDWLMKHRDSLDCVSNKVTLRTDKNNEIFMICEHQDYLSNIISAIRVERLVQKGCEACLAFVSDSVYIKFSVKDIRTMSDFPNVFLEECQEYLRIGRLSSLPGIAPKSIVPYRMTSKELAELKAQL
ncbi:alcohol-forming fatty acyl-CoA reductase-like [Gossypium australe]|uniref:Alcohol-forming fatty acyl-CoA reductase-like n=1 Tax=Gossypium australe TaxID=47621 RepID=A0A5B6VX48_9ROSI|nr:alcohol-forming fatty acyl-CoA reductase-like [Gossypium australe]